MPKRSPNGKTRQDRSRRIREEQFDASSRRDNLPRLLLRPLRLRLFQSRRRRLLPRLLLFVRRHLFPQLRLFPRRCPVPPLRS